MSEPSIPALFCLPHAGASAAGAYASWAEPLGDLARVIPLELAGRGTRVADPFHASLRAAAADGAARVRAQANGASFALLGHSIGGVLAYETAATLRAEGAPLPAGIVLSGAPPPSRPPLDPPMHMHSEEQFIAEVAALDGLPEVVMEHPAARAFHVEILREDYRLVETYELASPPHRLGMPLLLLHGSDDPLRQPDDDERWRQLAGGVMATRVVPGAEHFFPATHRDETLASVRAFLTPLLTGTTV